MKVLVGTITGIVLGVAGVAVASNTHATTAASVTPQVVLAQPAASARPVALRVQGLSGELTRKDTGAFELKVTVRQNGVLVDRDMRVLVARARVTNRLGQLVRLPLDDANARVVGSLLPRSAWRLDDDGQLLPTFAAVQVVLLSTTAAQGARRSEQADESGD